MPRYLLDTSVLAALLNNRPGAAGLITPWIRQQDATTSILAYGEVVEYIKPLASYSQRLATLRTLLRGIRPYLLSYSIMERYAAIRLHLRPRGQLIGDIDILIAATALERHLTLVTIDPDFERVPGLSFKLLTKEQLTTPSP
jgi:tRNA(fMet)-specific endonuclease VapC